MKSKRLIPNLTLIVALFAACRHSLFPAANGRRNPRRCRSSTTSKRRWPWRRTGQHPGRLFAAQGWQQRADNPWRAARHRRSGARCGRRQQRAPDGLCHGSVGGRDPRLRERRCDAVGLQDWSAYEGLSFWLYGQGAGASLFIDVIDNRKRPGAAATTTPNATPSPCRRHRGLEAGADSLPTLRGRHRQRRTQRRLHADVGARLPSARRRRARLPITSTMFCSTARWRRCDR